MHGVLACLVPMEQARPPGQSVHAQSKGFPAAYLAMRQGIAALSVICDWWADQEWGRGYGEQLGGEVGESS